ncbi:MAG TPA: hypothetical protein VMF07_03260 [Solirubrobacteraceae bacterium]|nr:hypothetical protein [Solirubrobacteraceae bacterium]
MLRKYAVACAGTAVAMLIAVGAADAKPNVRAGAGRAVPLSRAVVPAKASKPKFDVYNNGYAADSTCGGFDNHHTTNDWVEYSEAYRGDAQTLTNWEIGCVFQTSSTTKSISPESGCGDGSAPHPAQGAQVGFADGELLLVCGDPDVNSSNGTNANSVPYSAVSRGKACKATVLTGANGTKASRVKTSDSVQLDQDYTDYDGKSVSAVTTACVGTVPAKLTVSASVATRAIKCSQRNPFGSGKLASWGVTVTYPDRQFEEICEVPNAPVPSDLG